MNKLLVCALLLFFYSCASQSLVTPLRCENKNFWYSDKVDKSEFQSFKISKRIELVKTTSGFLRINIEDFLEENGISCEDIHSYSVSFTNDKADVLSRLFLIDPTQTITIEGLYMENDDEVIDSSANNYFEDYEIID